MCILGLVFLRYYGDLLALGRTSVEQGQAWHGLRAYVAAVEIQRHDLLSLLQVADVLESLGSLPLASRVLSAVARWGAHGGYPLLAILALKRLDQTGVDTEAFVQDLAKIYGKDSPRLGITTREQLQDLGAELPKGHDFGTPDPDALIARVEALLSPESESALRFPQQVPPLQLLSDLSPAEFVQVFSALELRRLPARYAVLRQGEAGTECYLIARGELSVWRSKDGERQDITTLGRGAVFGEMSLMSGEPRSANVSTLQPTDLLVIEPAAHQSEPAIATVLDRALQRFAHRRAVDNLLSRAELFSALDAQQRIDLLKRFVAYEGDTGTEWVRQGNPGTGLYLIVSGRCDVLLFGPGEPTKMATLTPGDVFGEISLLYDVPATASVISKTPATVLFLDKAYFTRLLSALPETRAYVESLGEDRLMISRLTASLAPPANTSESENESEEDPVSFLWT